MRYAWVFFASVFIEGLLLAVQVGIGVATGSPFSWASAAFIAVMAGMTLVTYNKAR